MFRVFRVVDDQGIERYFVYDVKNRKDVASFDTQAEAYQFIVETKP